MGLHQEAERRVGRAVTICWAGVLSQDPALAQAVGQSEPSPLEEIKLCAVGRIGSAPAKCVLVER